MDLVIDRQTGEEQGQEETYYYSIEAGSEYANNLDNVQTFQLPEALASKSIPIEADHIDVHWNCERGRITTKGYTRILREQGRVINDRNSTLMTPSHTSILLAEWVPLDVLVYRVRNMNCKDNISGLRNKLNMNPDEPFTEDKIELIKDSLVDDELFQGGILFLNKNLICVKEDKMNCYDTVRNIDKEIEKYLNNNKNRNSVWPKVFANFDIDKTMSNKDEVTQVDILIVEIGSRELVCEKQYSSSRKTVTGVKCNSRPLRKNENICFFDGLKDSKVGCRKMFYEL